MVAFIKCPGNVVNRDGVGIDVPQHFKRGDYLLAGQVTGIVPPHSVGHRPDGRSIVDKVSILVQHAHSSRMCVRHRPEKKVARGCCIFQSIGSLHDYPILIPGPGLGHCIQQRWKERLKSRQFSLLFVRIRKSTIDVAPEPNFPNSACMG
jgi:hypothetical protein